MQRSRGLSVLSEAITHNTELIISSSVDIFNSEDLFIGERKSILSSIDKKSWDGNQAMNRLKYEVEKIPSRPDHCILSDIHLEQGILLNEFLLYPNAIQTLTQAIQYNPSNRSAYIERAMAYFEMNQLPLALSDYEMAKKLTSIPPFKLANMHAVVWSIYSPENRMEFSKGLVLGTIEGAKVSTVEFVPSTLSCCRGIFNGLWAFVCSPIEIGEEITNAAYAVGEFISNHSCSECIQTLVPEIKELSLVWHGIDDHSKGARIGYIIGKYGVEIFAPIGAIKGVSKVRALKQANTMRTLESCASSAKQAKILEESSKIAAARTAILDSCQKGKILVKSSNVQFYVMQKKHAWDKLISLSGNVEEDFKKVLVFLEENKIIDPKYLRKTVGVPEHVPVKKLHILEYEATINGYQIEIFVEKYLETSETFLKNGWVRTR